MKPENEGARPRLAWSGDPQCPRHKRCPSCGTLYLSAMQRTGGGLFKALSAILFVVNKLGGRANFHKLFKILYFAEQKHCVRYGSDILGDYYVPMPYGPVPSAIYNVVKTAKNGKPEWLTHLDPEELSRYIHAIGHEVIGLRPADMDQLSEAEVECLEESIAENRDLSFSALTLKSHDAAWDEATRNEDVEMNWLAIARAGNASVEMLDYLRSTFENQYLFRQ